VAAAFGRDPHDVLRGVFDVAGLAVHAVLRVDLQAVDVVIVSAGTSICMTTPTKTLKSCRPTIQREGLYSCVD